MNNMSKKINFDLKNIFYWLRANKISNTSKTETILFRTKKEKNKNTSKICVQTINNVKEARYWGLKLDQHLTLKQHMKKIQNKALQIINFKSSASM